MRRERKQSNVLMEEIIEECRQEEMKSKDNAWKRQMRLELVLFLECFSDYYSRHTEVLEDSHLSLSNSLEYFVSKYVEERFEKKFMNEV